MRKIILLASALALGGVAYAQDTTQPPTSSDAASGMPSSSGQMGDQTMTPPAPDASTPPASGDMTGTPPASGDQSMTPPAGGDPSMGGASSMPADPNAGGMGGGAMGAQPGSATGPNGPVSMTPTQGPTDLPMCSKTVTDNCKQGAGKSGGHRATHRRGKK